MIHEPNDVILNTLETADGDAKLDTGLAVVH
jgi:hypothetical protein